MQDFEKSLRAFSKELYEINAIKFGEFKTKIGLMTPIYCDLRVLVSHPKHLDTLANLLVKRMKEIDEVDLLCGVPYTALPIATVVSLKTLIPMVMRRKEPKDYGTKQLIEGSYKENEKCLIVEDVVTSGSSILETVRDLNGCNIKCSDAIVLLDRQQGGEEFLKSHNIKMHALLNLTQLMEYLKDEGCVDDKTVKKVKDYIDSTKIDKTCLTKSISEDRLVLNFMSRVKFAKNPVAIELFKIMSLKQTNLCVAADITDATKLLNFAEQVGPYICVFKTHIDILEDFHPNLIEPLKSIAEKHNFILFEDRKFADIGKTVELQYCKGLYSMSTWAKIVTVHSLMGKGTLDAISGCNTNRDKGVFLLAEASSEGNLITKQYVDATLKLSEQYPELITGMVCQSALFKNNPGLIQLTPGVQIDIKCDDLGQRYTSPECAILEKGADIVVVGRGITKSATPAETAEKYRKILWETYIKRVEKQ